MNVEIGEREQHQVVNEGINGSWLIRSRESTTMTLQHETTTQEQGHIARRQSVGRRGLIAGAAALVAGIVAAKTSEPVAAGTDGDIALNVFNAIYATTGVQAKEATGSFNVNWQGSPVFKGDASLLPDTSSFIPPGVPYFSYSPSNY